MAPELWLAFVTTSTILLVIPGPTILTVVSYALSHGSRLNAVLVAAVALGDATALTLSICGLGPLLKASAFWFTVVKTAGGLYLMFLGVRLFWKGVSPMDVQAITGTVSRRHVFANTWLVTALNPKGIVFFVAFLPQFVSADSDVTTQLWILATTFVVMAAVNTGLYVVFASSARRMLESTSAQKKFKVVGGSLLSLAGLWALLAG